MCDCVGCRCIKTFEVEQYDEGVRQYKRINAEDTIVNLFVHATGTSFLFSFFIFLSSVVVVVALVIVVFVSNDDKLHISSVVSPHVVCL